MTNNETRIAMELLCLLPREPACVTSTDIKNDLAIEQCDLSNAVRHLRQLGFGVVVRNAARSRVYCISKRDWRLAVTTGQSWWNENKES